MFREIKQEIKKFCMYMCNILNLTFCCCIGILLSYLGNLNLLPSILATLVIGLITMRLNLNLIRNLHNLLIPNFRYRKLVMKVFRIYFTIINKIRPEHITSVHLKLSEEYCNNYYFKFTLNRRHSLLQEDDNLLCNLGVPFEAIKLAPNYIGINMNNNNRGLLIALCFYMTCASVIFMLMFGPYAILLYSFSLLFLILAGVLVSAIQDAIFLRIFLDETRVSDFLYLNAFDDLYLVKHTKDKTK